MTDTTPRRRSRRLLLAGATAALATATLAAPAGATTWGIADQKPTTFTNPAFTQLKDAGMRTARYTMRFDALKYRNDASRKFYAEQVDAWMTAARAAGVRPLVTFWVTASNSSALKRSISSSAYRTEFKRFRAAYPFVKDFSLFNEPNLTGPFKSRPEALGKLYKAVKKDLRSCSGCNLLAGDLHLENGATTAAYAARVAKGAGTKVGLWGINNYHDVNDRTTTETARFLRSPAVRGSKVWITESGGVYSRKASSEKGSPFLAQRKKATSDGAREKYQYDATRYLRTIATKYRSQIQRGYVYQLQSEPHANWVPGTRNGSWDSGLIDPRGVKRRSFDYVLNTFL
ncbi:hypothetical protein [Patulibacter sp.]|uniref:hypothetical protein n=1 Tax=Patulibacter sp. TaxID=1912859 RepID=UPI0027245FFE|nr:hypothetical protein [Patulibacter sp.]MDO9409806.1 hypothetical protein [Patulibacter sp.]